MYFMKGNPPKTRKRIFTRFDKGVFRANAVRLYYETLYGYGCMG